VLALEGGPPPFEVVHRLFGHVVHGRRRRNLALGGQPEHRAVTDLGRAQRQLERDSLPGRGGQVPAPRRRIDRLAEHPEQVRHQPAQRLVDRQYGVHLTLPADDGHPAVDRSHPSHLSDRHNY
jgi:hypothetical protein